MVKKLLFTIFIVGIVLLSFSIQVAAQTPIPPKFTGKLFGVTVDDVSDTDEVVGQLKKFKSQNPQVFPIVRVVFDVDKDPRKFNPNYLQAVRRIKQETGMLVMGEIMDSYSLHLCVARNGRGEINKEKSVLCYEKRTRNYLNGLGDLVDIWEIGNEVNGEWSGWDDKQGGSANQPRERLKEIRDTVAAQLGAAYRVLTSAGKQTAITFYFNDDDPTGQGVGKKSWDSIDYSFFNWAKTYKANFSGIQYVFISYWQDDVFDNHDESPIVPDAKKWAEIFKALKGDFGNANFGFGEVGNQCNYEAGDSLCRPLNVYGRDKDKALCRIEPAEIQPKRRCSCCLTAQTEYINRYYLRDDAGIRRELAKIDPKLEKSYSGGYFWWYFNDDVINKFTAAKDLDNNEVERNQLSVEAERTSSALVNALNVWLGGKSAFTLFGFGQEEKLSAVREPVYQVLQPGDTTKPNPYTILIINNPVYQVGKAYSIDPISLQPMRFAESVDYIYANLFGNLPHQAEKLLAEPSIRNKIRVVAVFIPNLPAKEEFSLVEITNLLQARQANFAGFLNKQSLDNADVVFAVSAYSSILRASAFRALETRDCDGKDFTFDGGTFRHCYSSYAPGAIAIHADSRSMTALHEFGHGASSYPYGFLNDLYTLDFTESSLIINKKSFKKTNGANLPKTFAIYNDKPYPRDEKISDSGTTYLYSPKRIDPEFPSLMDDYRLPKNGFPEQCQYDGLSRQFLFDRITVKIER